MNSGCTPSELARRYGVSPDKVLAWIRAGELRAVNVATRCTGRPRYVILPEAISAFEAARSVAPPPRVARKRRATDPKVIQYF